MTYPPYDWVESTPSPYCGRIDDHEPHGKCPGPPATEGAVPCSWCKEPTKNAGPLCIPCALELRRIDQDRDEEWWR